MSWIIDADAVVASGRVGPPCAICTDPENDNVKCKKPAGDHTILDHPICDECWEAIRL